MRGCLSALILLLAGSLSMCEAGQTTIGLYTTASPAFHDSATADLNFNMVRTMFWVRSYSPAACEEFKWLIRNWELQRVSLRCCTRQVDKILCNTLGQGRKALAMIPLHDILGIRYPTGWSSLMMNMCHWHHWGTGIGIGIGIVASYPARFYKVEEYWSLWLILQCFHQTLWSMLDPTIIVVLWRCSYRSL